MREEIWNGIEIDRKWVRWKEIQRERERKRNTEREREKEKYREREQKVVKYFVRHTICGFSLNTSSAKRSEPVQEMNRIWWPSFASASAMFLPTPPTDLLVVPLKVLPFSCVCMYGCCEKWLYRQETKRKWTIEIKLKNKPLKWCDA